MYKGYSYLLLFLVNVPSNSHKSECINSKGSVTLVTGLLEVFVILKLLRISPRWSHHLLASSWCSFSKDLKFVSARVDGCMLQSSICICISLYFFWFCFAFGHYSFVLVFSLFGYDEGAMGVST